MRNDFTFRRQAIFAGVALLVLVDGALAVYSWQLVSAPQTPRQQFSLEMRQHDLLKADIKRAQDIRDKIPAIQKDCDQFEQSLFPASAGYSSVSSELGSIAKKRGVQLEGLSFRQTEIAGRGTTEVAIDATVNGDYKSVVQFLNSVQRSANLYEVDTLTLAPENANQGTSGVLKVSLHLKTYFRTAA
jgi:type IV pilus assembly protein PilO